MKQPFKLSIAIAITLSTAMLTVAHANDSFVTTKAYFGGKTIDDNAWSAQDGHGSIGMLTDVNTGFHGIRIALDLFGSGSEDNTTSQVKGTYMAEAHLGLRKVFDLQSQFKPYMGGGINFAYATQTNDDGSGKTEEEDMDIGIWLNGGVDYLLTDKVTVGVDLRYATSDVELYGKSVELDATAIGATLGYRW
jgi:opacity protein-like surface antigen